MYIGLNAPVLSENYTVVKMDNGTYEVTVWWTKGNCVPDDVEYNLTLTDTSSEGAVNNVMKQTQTTLYLNQGIKYVIAVTAQLCDGDLKSETSNELPLYCAGMALKYKNYIILLSALFRFLGHAQLYQSVSIYSFYFPQ